MGMLQLHPYCGKTPLFLYIRTSRMRKRLFRTLQPFLMMKGGGRHAIRKLFNLPILTLKVMQVSSNN